MAHVKYQKVKLLVLYEILRQESSKEQPLTTRQLCDKLIARDIPCDRRTLAMDVAMLNELGFIVHSRYVAHALGYYLDERSFSVAELKIMMDAVQAANFIPEEQSSDMMEKLAVLGGTSRAELLKNNLIVLIPANTPTMLFMPQSPCWRLLFRSIKKRRSSISI